MTYGSTCLKESYPSLESFILCIIGLEHTVLHLDMHFPIILIEGNADAITSVAASAAAPAMSHSLAVTGQSSQLHNVLHRILDGFI